MRTAGALMLAALITAVLLGVATAGPAATVRVIVNGVEVPQVIPAVVRNGQILAPIPGLFEPMGASAAYYEADRSIVITNRVRTTVILRVSEPMALVNGQQRPLTVAPVMAGDHVLVPAQPIFAILGAWTKFEEADQTLHVSSQITGITTQVEGGQMRLQVEATGPITTESNVLTNPDRLVVDFQQAALRAQAREIPVNAAGVQRIRTAQFQVKPYVTRVVFDLTQPVEMQITAAPKTYAVSIALKPKGLVTPAPSTPPPSGGDVGGRHGTTGVKIMQVDFKPVGETGRLTIAGTGGPMQYKIREFVFPNRLTIDIQDAVFIPVKQEVSVNSESILNVRASQFQATPPVVRVVVTLKRKTAYVVGQVNGQLTMDITDSPLRGHLVAIDPGHGGSDPGAIGPTGLRESDIVLDVALRLRELLARDGIRTVMTREADVSMELGDRPKFARERGATMFVSIHANASTRAEVNGSETYYLTAQSLVLAQMIQDELGALTGTPSRGIKTANFLVLRDNDVPTVLVETAFLTHADDETRLRDVEFRQRLAQAIYSGINRFLAIYPVPPDH
jgi:N-acetylmuramoyl-L-alanine amidase